MIKCCECGCTDESKMMITAADGKVFCESCTDDLLSACAVCGELFIRETLLIIDNEYFCPHCAETKRFCSECHDVHNIDEMYLTVDDDFVCSSCFDDYYAICDICGRARNIYYVTNKNNKRICDYCYDDYLEEIGVHNYNYKPDYFNFLDMDEDDNNIHIGVELEIQGVESEDFCKRFTAIYSNDDVFYLKEDGSLNDCGVEIVSNPMTYKYITQSDDWKHCFEYLKQYEMNNNRNCGLHFHIERNGLSNDQIATIDYIINNYNDFFELMGGRQFNDYCKLSHKSSDDWGRDTVDRYHAVNLTNKYTIELRFCQSTSDYDTFMKRVKLIFSIIKFSSKYKIEDICNNDYPEFMKKFNEIFMEMN